MKMKNVLVVLLTVGLLTVFITGCGDTKVRDARDRVETILKGFTKVDGKIVGDEETAVCMWWANKFRLDGRILDHASNEFDKWRNEGKFPTWLDSYEITDVREVGYSMVVSGFINGSEFKMRVPEGKPISWLEAPDAESGGGDYED